MQNAIVMKKRDLRTGAGYCQVGSSGIEGNPLIDNRAPCYQPPPPPKEPSWQEVGRKPGNIISCSDGGEGGEGFAWWRWKRGPLLRHHGHAEVQETVGATVIHWSRVGGTGHMEERKRWGNCIETGFECIKCVRVWVKTGGKIGRSLKLNRC
jgi:hypothetical protein